MLLERSLLELRDTLNAIKINQEEETSLAIDEHVAVASLAGPSKAKTNQLSRQQREEEGT
jgi:hypothetical protein